MGHADAGRHDDGCRASLGAAALPDARPTRSPTCCAPAACCCRPSWRCASPARDRARGLSLPRRAGPQGVDRESAELARAGLGAAPSLESRQGARADLQRQRQRQALLGALRRQRRARPLRRLRPSRRSCRTTTPEARLDFTRLLATAVLEREAGARLRWLEQCGFLLRKLETYDTRYRDAGDAYEWAMPTGGHGLRFAAPRVIVTMRRTGGSVADHACRWRCRANGSSASPTARGRPPSLPTPAEVAERARRAMQVRGSDGRPGRPQRIAELLRGRRRPGQRLGQDQQREGLPGLSRQHSSRLLPMPPRYWQGWDIQEDLLLWYVFRDLLPAPAQDHLKAYWRAWLQPDLPTDAFVHPQSRDAIDYWKRNKDWRGRASFFRDGYNYAVSTQNFNHTAAMGALLGGAMIGAANAIADGRHGLETLPLRFWSFLDGSTQEMLDHYYLSITLSGQKMFADYGPTPIDRLMGRILLDRTMEMLITRLPFAAAPLRLLVGPRADLRRAGRAGRHLRRAAHRLEGRHADPSRRQRRAARRRACRCGATTSRPAGSPSRRLQQPWAPSLDGGPDRRQAGAVRGDRGGDHARQLQAAAVAALLSRPLARARLGRHPRRHGRRHGAMGARAAEGRRAWRISAR